MNGQTTKKASSLPLGVHHEWGQLKEAIVGLPVFRFPSHLPESLKNFLPGKGLAMFENHPGKWLKDCAPELFHQGNEQIDGIIKILRDRGIVVHQEKDILPSEEAFLANLGDTCVLTYPRDPIVVIGNRFIETSMFEPFRRKERFPIRRTIGERVTNSGANFISMPQPEPFPGNKDGGYGPGPFLEGGDVMLAGRDILVGNSGNASNTAGIRWLQANLGDDYRVQEIPITDRFLHLDCVLALPRPGLAVICKEGFVNGVPDFLADWKLIEVSAEDAKTKLGCNALVLDEKSMIVGEDMPQLAEALTAEAVNVLTAPIDAITWQGGGFRCWHHPLIRVS